MDLVQDGQNLFLQKLYLLFLQPPSLRVFSEICQFGRLLHIYSVAVEESTLFGGKVRHGKMTSDSFILLASPRFDSLGWFLFGFSP